MDVRNDIEEVIVPRTTIIGCSLFNVAED